MIPFASGSLTTSAAQAAFPGRNGLIILPIKVDPVPPQAPEYFDDLDLFTLGPDGTPLRQFTAGPAADFDPAWSPVGTRLAFARTSQFAIAGDIVVTNRDGTALTNLTNSPHHDEFAPDWSPDGKKLVFTSWDNTPTYVIYDVLTPISPGGDIYTMNADGSNVAPLVEAPGDQGLPAWSPAGDWIAYTDVPSKTLSVIRPDGSDQHAITVSGRFGKPPFEAEWSPDGRRLVFGALDRGDADIWVVGLDGKGLRNLTGMSGAHDQFATWSPDGKHLAFISDREGGWRLFSMRANGAAARKLIDIDLVGGDFSRPDWGPRP